MDNIKVVDATIEHAWAIAANMRAADIDECIAECSTPLEALVRGIHSSTWCVTVLLDEVPTLMFGVAPVAVLNRIGAPWLLGTDDIHRIRRPFIRECRGYVDRMLETYPTLQNVVDARNKTSIRWLKWLGFQMKPVVEVNGYDFYPFEMRAA